MDDIIISFVVERQKLLGHGEPMADTIRSLRGGQGNHAAGHGLTGLKGYGRLSCRKHEAIRKRIKALIGSGRLAFDREHRIVPARRSL